MKEQLARIPQPERPATPERSANESDYGSIEVDIDLTKTLADIKKLEQTLATPPIKESLPEGFPDLETAQVEEVIADEVFTANANRLTRWHFTEEGIKQEREKLYGVKNDLSDAPIITPPLPDSASVIVADEVFAAAPKRLTREDFTKEAIERARNPQNFNQNQTVAPFNYPEHLKIEPHLRVPTTELASDGLPKKLPPLPPIKPNNPLTRADFPGTGKATMPELVYKKAAPKKSFFRKLIPSFLSRFF